MRLGLVIALVALAAGAEAQTVTGARFTLTTGPCTLRSGSGAPGSSLGVVCDLYVRTDSPYGTYRKTGASTWTLLVPEPGTTGITTVGALGTGSITSGFGAIDVGADGITGGAFSGTTGAFSTSVTSPLFTHSGAASVTTAIGNLTLAPAGDVIFNPTGNDLLPTTGYTLNIGALTNQFLTMHVAELWAQMLVPAETLASIGGRLLVGPTTTLTSDLAAAATSISVKHNEISNGDRLVMQANGKYERMLVTSGASGSGPYTYSVTRNTDGSGANDWFAGDAVFNTGTTGDGFIDLYSLNGIFPGSTAGPTIAGNVRTGTGDTDIAVRWAIGNLNGLYGYGATTYGTAFGDPSNTNVTIDATNGFRIRNGTTNKLTADTSGNLSIVGDLSVGTSGVIRSGATAYGTGTGYWLDYNGGTPRFRVGTTSGNRVDWDGTNLVLQSANLTVNSSGTKITSWNTLDTSCPGSCQDLTRAYAFSPASAGFMGLQGLIGSTSGAQELHLINDISGGSGPYAVTKITAESTAIAMSSGGTIAMTASTGVSFGNDLTIFQNNGNTAGASPYLRSDGNYLVVESRTAANGGNIYIAGDNLAHIYLGSAGGTTYVYAPDFPSTAPNWASSLSQTTVGAAGAASALPANPVGYIKVKVNGANYIVPVYNP